MRRPPEALLLDIQSASRRLETYISGFTLEEFLADDKTKAAAIREIEIIGEACIRLPSEYRNAHPEVAWADFARLRNLYIHVYERIRYDRVWATATRTIPALAAAIEPLIPAEPENT
jgi:uncharacterized protein with HEPN domain